MSFTPEINHFINSVTQDKKPVYNQKQWLASVSDTILGNPAQSIKMPIDQQENILLVVLTDLVFNRSGLGANATLQDALLFNNPVFTCIDNFQTPIVMDNFNYTTRGEYFYLYTLNTNCSFSIGYIRVSQKT